LTAGDKWTAGFALTGDDPPVYDGVEPVSGDPFELDAQEDTQQQLVIDAWGPASGDPFELDTREEPLNDAFFPQLQGPESRFSFTLITQTSIDKLRFLEEMSKRWPAPISAAVFVPFGTTQEQVERVIITNYKFPARVVFSFAKEGPPATRTGYPINAMRNLARANVKTTHFLMLDVDLLPSVSLHAELLALPDAYLGPGNHALVVPAFEVPSSTVKVCVCAFVYVSVLRFPHMYMCVYVCLCVCV
jgi:hypothetical protein